MGPRAASPSIVVSGSASSLDFLNHTLGRLAVKDAIDPRATALGECLPVIWRHQPRALAGSYSAARCSNATEQAAEKGATPKARKGRPSP